MPPFYNLPRLNRMTYCLHLGQELGPSFGYLVASHVSEVRAKGLTPVVGRRDPLVEIALNVFKLPRDFQSCLCRARQEGIRDPLRSLRLRASRW